MKIVHVDAERGFSGGERQVFLLMEGLRERGHEGRLVAPPGSRAAAHARERGFEVDEVPMRSDLDARAVWRLRRMLRRTKPELVHLHTGRATWLGALAARGTGIPALATRRVDRRVRPGRRTRWLYGQLLRRVVAISPAVAGQLRGAGVPDAQVQVIPSAVDPEELAPTRPREAVRAELGAGAQDVVLLTLATLHARKGLDVLLDAVAELAPRAAAPFAVWIAGDGPERAALEARAARQDLMGCVRLLGERSDRADLLAACDVFVLPSRREGLGVAALEAMAVGRPVVASAVGGLAQAVEPERTGLLVPPGKAAALAEALERLIKDRALREQLGAAGPARVAQGHGAAQMIEAYQALYRELLAAEAGDA